MFSSWKPQILARYCIYCFLDFMFNHTVGRYILQILLEFLNQYMYTFFYGRLKKSGQDTMVQVRDLDGFWMKFEQMFHPLGNSMCLPVIVGWTAKKRMERLKWNLNQLTIIKEQQVCEVIVMLKLELVLHIELSTKADLLFSCFSSTSTEVYFSKS